MKRHEKALDRLFHNFYMVLVTVLLMTSSIPVNNIVAAEAKTLSFENEKYQVILTYDKESDIPEGAVLHVEEIDSEDDKYDEYASKTRDLLNWENDDFKLCSYLNVSIVDADNNVVIPQNKVSIKVVLAEEEETDIEEEKELTIEETNVIALNDESTLINGVTADTIVSDDTDLSLQFDNESKEKLSFPVMVLAQTVKEKVVKASDDNTYVIKAVYDADSGIPLNAEFVVSEISEDDENYDAYIEKSADELRGTSENVLFARAFDISFIDPETNEEYQPDGSVSISIQLLDEELGDYANLDVVHIHGKDSEQIDVVESALEDDELKFVTDGLSVFVVVCTNLRQILTASDGNEYLVTVKYHFPQNDIKIFQHYIPV